MSLSTRLSLLVALIAIGVTVTVGALEISALDRNIERGLVQAAQLASQSAAEVVAGHENPLDLLDIRDALHDLLNADPAIDVVSLVRLESDAHVEVVASTSTEERGDTIELARRAALTQAAQEGHQPTVVVSAHPVPHHPGYATVATVGLESLLQARAQGMRTAGLLALPIVLVLLGLVHVVMRRVVGQPVAAIVATMERAANGEHQARAAVNGRDELATIAHRLNEMLDRLEDFNASLKSRIGEATRDLSARNAELAAQQTQLLTLRESLARAERVAALGQAAATVAHQAGTPLNLVSGYVQMIRDDPHLDERVRCRLQTVDTQIQQVIKVLRTFLDRARPASGRELVSLDRIVEHIREIAAPRLQQSGIVLHCVIAPDVPPVHADATQLEMALLNLVNNARDAMAGGGTLHIALTAQSDSVHLIITDSGPGIAAGVLDHLFDAWVTTKPAGQGSGLGLAIVQDVVRAHGGRITATNTGAGARFSIELPAAWTAHARHL